tara:strand:- start:188 stop:631 length:444 start_codon:yes stop_codon:yes gene_type:complete
MTEQFSIPDKLAQDHWVRVAFLTLTDRNLTPLDLHKRKVRSFLFRLSCRLRVHLAVVVGSELGKTHSHLVIAVPVDEVDRFRTNLKKHRIAGWWNAQHDPVLKMWDASLADRGMTYTCVKHDLWERQPGVFCPRKAHTCEKGNCPHT